MVSKEKDIQLNNILLALDKQLRKVQIKPEVREKLRKAFIDCYKNYDESEYYRMTGESVENYCARMIKSLGTCKRIIDISETSDWKDAGVSIDKIGGYYKIGGDLVINFSSFMNLSSTFLHEISHIDQQYLCNPTFVGSMFLYMSLHEGEAIDNENIVEEIRRGNTLPIYGYDSKRIEFKSFAPNSFDYLLYNCLKLFMGNKFLEQWKNDSTLEVDYIKMMKEQLTIKFGSEKLANDFLKTMFKVLCLVARYNNEDYYHIFIREYYRLIEISNIYNLSSIGYEIDCLEKRMLLGEAVEIELYTARKIKSIIESKINFPQEYSRNIDASKRLISEVEQASESDLYDTLLEFQQLIIMNFGNMCYGCQTVEELIEFRASFDDVIKCFARVYEGDRDVTDRVLGIDNLEFIIDSQQENLRTNDKCSRLQIPVLPTN